MATLDGPRRQHTDQGRERKQQLLDAAADLFASRGYETTRIADICEAAGVAKGLFYWYFETKESLFAELVRSMRQQLRRAQAAAMDPNADPVTRLRQGTEASVRFMADHRAFFALLEGERNDESIAAVLREGSEVYVEDTRTLVLEAQREGLIPDDHDAGLLALGILGAVSHYSLYLRTGRIDLGVDELARFAGDWVVRSVGGEVPVGDSSH
ncbi:MAG TPA: TetR/AcrR family transcriptional regulator [Acidimicrobiales bacterium]|jgi:AcrR family transcriptional regulator|nr:TetR/AcrR family transcriptional regulator [Acidimicrobiales bacterium]